MNRLLLIPLVCVLLAATAEKTSAIHTCRSTCVKCPRCQGCCNLEVGEEKVKKHYWTVESEQICIPNLVFPWQNPGLNKRGSHCGCGNGQCNGGCSATGCSAFGGCSGSAGCGGGCGNGCGGSRCGRVAHNGGRVITICKPKKNAYECPACKYTWTAVGGGSGCSAADKKKDDDKKDDKKSSDKDKDKENEKSPTPPDESAPESEADVPQKAPPMEDVSPEPAVEEAIPEAPSAAPAEFEPVAEPTPTSSPSTSLQRTPIRAYVPQFMPQPAQPPEPDFSIVDPFSRPSVFGRGPSAFDTQGRLVSHQERR